MLAIIGVMSIASAAGLACGATKTRFEKQLDVVSGLLLVGGLSMIGVLVSASTAVPV